MYKKLYPLLLALLFPCWISAQVPFTLITVPKSGSHLIIKALHLMTGTSPIWHVQFPSFWCVPPEHGFLYTHFCVSDTLEDNYRSLPDLKKVILIRDLRDVAVSIVKQIRKTPWPGMSQADREAFLKLSPDEQLLFAIQFEYDVYEVAEKAPNSNQVSLVRIAEQALCYAQDPTHLVIRYEDLVGNKGGGSSEKQCETLAALARFIECDLSQEKLSTIAAQLYGNDYNPFGKEDLKNYRSTFAKGKIGSWKEAFKTEHILAFKEKMGHLLIQLGYEKDLNW